MLIKRKKSWDIPESDVTEHADYLSRRRFIQQAGVGLASATGLVSLEAAAGTKLAGVKSGSYTVDEELTPYSAATSYNNFYEFGTDKEDPARLAGSLKPRPWTVSVEGEVEKPGVVDVDELIRPHALEERIYRLRCVEAWSMVIPWLGFPLGDVLKRFQPTSRAKFVVFETLFDPEQFPGQRRRILNWPYVEGLRMDEAMHPLAILAVGMYGEVLPNQNGAPLRLVVPWKYGFKSIKSIVKIRLSEQMPTTAWMAASPKEYGFYANVNPKVDHPRWSQARERRIGDFFKRPTLMFNGYWEEVGAMYARMDLKVFF
ncbi:MAG TPA: protein-methionine-sulfoxide reductase catalytic subunit MsrP [Gammaproteobacteria bacterium]|nr:protein-methionine-sulfoxide reductase catalytic subunit MsrP [Gammaproteobacteria bacterium]